MLVRFLSRSFFAGSIVEAGDVRPVSDDTVLGQHMVKVEGDNDHLVDAQPFTGSFRADLAYSVDPDEVRAQLTEELRLRAEETRVREAEEERLRIEASTGSQPETDVGGSTTSESSQKAPENPDQGGGSADG